MLFVHTKYLGCKQWRIQKCWKGDVWKAVYYQPHRTLIVYAHDELYAFYMGKGNLLKKIYMLIGGGLPQPIFLPCFECVTGSKLFISHSICCVWFCHCVDLLQKFVQYAFVSFLSVHFVERQKRSCYGNCWKLVTSTVHFSSPLSLEHQPSVLDTLTKVFS